MDAFGVRLVAVGNAVQKRQDLIGRKLSKLMISKILTESTNDGLVRLDGIFFSNGRCGNRSRFLRLLRLS